MVVRCLFFVHRLVLSRLVLYKGFWPMETGKKRGKRFKPPVFSNEKVYLVWLFSQLWLPFKFSHRIFFIVVFFIVCLNRLFRIVVFSHKLQMLLVWKGCDKLKSAIIRPPPPPPNSPKPSYHQRARVCRVMIQNDGAGGRVNLNLSLFNLCFYLATVIRFSSFFYAE